MLLKVVVDNNTYIDMYYKGEPALSFYIEDEEEKILFDTGYSDIFLDNLKKFNININGIGKVVISHGHDDHTGGLKYYFEENLSNRITVIAHPDAFNEKVIDNLKICSPISKSELESKTNLILSKLPIEVSKNIIFLGEIPQINDFEKRKAIGEQIIENNVSDDFVFDDSALVYKAKNGLYIITGCSHSGICNIIEYAKEACNDTRILGVIGGFHLFEIDEQVMKTIQYLKSNNIKEIYPCHCTSFKVKAEINKHIIVKEVGVGLQLGF